MSDYSWTEYIVSIICNISRTIRNNKDLFQLEIHSSTIDMVRQLNSSLCNFD